MGWVYISIYTCNDEAYFIGMYYYAMEYRINSIYIKPYKIKSMTCVSPELQGVPQFVHLEWGQWHVPFSLVDVGYSPCLWTHVDAWTTNNNRIIESLTNSDCAWRSCIGQDHHTTTAKHWVGLSMVYWVYYFFWSCQPIFWVVSSYPTVHVSPSYSPLVSTVNWGWTSTPFRFQCNFLLSTINIIVKHISFLPTTQGLNYLHTKFQEWILLITLCGKLT